MISEIKKIAPSDFLLAIQREGTVELAIDEVSDVKKSKFDDGYYMYIDFKVLSDLIYMEDNLKDSVVGLAYSLKEDKGNDGHFVISEKQKIYPLLQYAVNQNGYRIRSSFRCNEEDIHENLEGLEFKGVVENKNNHSLLKPVK